jgi:putative transcriptional regulator
MIAKVVKIQLEKLLKAKDKTLYWLAKETGISYNALSKISKNNVTRLELDTIEKICITLQCSTGELLELEI